MRSLYLICLALLFASCRINGLTDDFGKLDDAQKARIVNLSSFSQTDTSKIYKISAKQLLAQIEKEDKTLVYVFTNGCASKYCKPLFYYENYAKNNGYNLYLVMNGYAYLDETLVQPRQMPIYAINSSYYQTNYRGTYTRLFMNELRGKPADYDKWEGTLIYFSKGKYTKTSLDVLPM